MSIALKDPRGAIQLLEAAMARARAGAEWKAFSSLAKPAGVVSTALNEFDAALLYYQEAARHDPDDVSLVLAVADIYRRQGRVADAHAALEDCFQRATRNGQTEFAEIASQALAQLEHGD